MYQQFILINFHFKFNFYSKHSTYFIYIRLFNHIIINKYIIYYISYQKTIKISDYIQQYEF